MSWQPEPKPAWVVEFNRGDGSPVDDGRPFDWAELAAETQVRAGRTPDDGDGFVAGFSDPEGFEILTRSLEDEAELTPLGRWATRRYLNRLADVRTQMADFLIGQHDLGPIVEPIFVIGAPRTGTTALHRLLSCVSSLRAPEGWELLRPLPAPTPETFGEDPRVGLAEAELSYPQQVSAGLRAIHAYTARMPKECLSAMSFSGRSEEFISRYAVDGYADWLAKQSMTDAYRAHRSVLQVLQLRMPARTWVLKSPVHLQSIAELIESYPDARFVVTHRDPSDVLASVSSLVCTLRSAFSDCVDPAAVGRYHLELYSASLNRLVDHVDSGVLDSARTVHMWHRDIVENPAEEAIRACDALGVEVSEADRKAIASTAMAAREDGAGMHRYDATDFGLGEFDRTEYFGRYLNRFELA